jgi:hypothetical protein
MKSKALFDARIHIAIRHSVLPMNSELLHCHSRTALRCRNPVVTRAAKNYACAGSSGLFAPFCPRVFFLSVHPSGRWMVGAVGIEPTTFGLKGRCSTTELRPCFAGNSDNCWGRTSGNSHRRQRQFQARHRVLMHRRAVASFTFAGKRESASRLLRSARLRRRPNSTNSSTVRALYSSIAIVRNL